MPSKCADVSTRRCRVSPHLYQPRVVAQVDVVVNGSEGPSPPTKKVSGCSERLAGTTMKPIQPMPPICSPHFIAADALQRNMERLHDRPVEKRRAGSASVRPSTEPHPPVIKRSDETIHDIVARLSTNELQRRERHRSALEERYLQRSRPASSRPVSKATFDRLYTGGLQRDAAVGQKLADLYTPRRASKRLPKASLDELSSRLATPRGT